MDNKVLKSKYKNKITALKIKLARTDYLAIKYAEGAITIAEYAATRDLRKQWRTEINALEAQIAALGE